MKTIQLQSLFSNHAKHSEIAAENEICTKSSVIQKPKERFCGSEGTPKCWYCKSEEDETIEHFFLTCGKFGEVRAILLQQLKSNLESLGEQGMQAWEAFYQGSATLQAQIILGLLNFGANIDDVIGEFREQYVAKAWNERIVI